MLAKSSYSKILFVVFLTVFFDMLGIGIIIPVLPMLILPSSPFKVISSNWGIDNGVIFAGWLLATFSLAQFLSTPILGQLSDKYGRRKILIYSILGSSGGYLLFGVAIVLKNIPLMFLARILDGASGGNISIAQAVIGDVSLKGSQAKNFGLIGVALGLGFMFGPFLGGVLSNPQVVVWFGVTTPFWFACGCGIFNLWLVFVFLPETRVVVAGIRRINILKPIQNIIKALLIKEIRGIMLVLFLFNAGFAFFTSFWGVILVNRFNFNQGMVGNFFAYMGITIVLAQGLVVRRLSGKVANSTVLNYSLIGTGICLILFYLIPVRGHFWIYCLPPFLAIGVALTKAFSSALIIQVTPSIIRGEVMGINSSLSALAQALATIFAGYCATQHIGFPVLVGSIIIIVGGIVFRQLAIARN